MLSNNAIIGIASAVVFVGGGAAVYYYNHRTQPVQSAQPAPVVEAPPMAQEPPEHHPVPGPVADAKPLPELSDSDPPLLESLTALFGAKPLEEFLNPQDIIRHLVVTIDNLPNKKVALRLSPIKQMPQKFLTQGTPDSPVLSAENYARYAPFVRIVQAADAKSVAALYFHFYPLFQRAYEDLGYPGQYFNDRLVKVIDHLLETPEVAGPVALTQPNVFYEFADPELQARSFGQKAMIRMGKENVAALKTKLRQLREEVTKGEGR